MPSVRDEKMMKMKWLWVILFLVAMPAHADQSTGTACRFGVGQDRYCVIAATYEQLFIELRNYSGDRLFHDVVLISRYMEPEYEIKDVVLDEYEEVIVRTRGGGTGIKETHLNIFGFISDRIVCFGDFIVDRQLILPDRQENRSGAVSFPEKNKLIYRYTDSVVQGSQSVGKDVTETFVFDSGALKYTRTKEPEQTVAPDRLRSR